MSSFLAQICILWGRFRHVWPSKLLSWTQWKQLKLFWQLPPHATSFLIREFQLVTFVALFNCTSLSNNWAGGGPNGSAVQEFCLHRCVELRVDANVHTFIIQSLHNIFREKKHLIWEKKSKKIRKSCVRNADVYLLMCVVHLTHTQSHNRCF